MLRNGKSYKTLPVTESEKVRFCLKTVTWATYQLKLCPGQWYSLYINLFFIYLTDYFLYKRENFQISMGNISQCFQINFQHGGWLDHVEILALTFPMGHLDPPWNVFISVWPKSTQAPVEQSTKFRSVIRSLVIFIKQTSIRQSLFGGTAKFTGRNPGGKRIHYN